MEGLKTKEERAVELKCQSELILGYITKISLNKWAIDDVIDSMYADLRYLEQEYGILQANKILNND